MQAIWNIGLEWPRRHFDSETSLKLTGDERERQDDGHATVGVCWHHEHYQIFRRPSKCADVSHARYATSFCRRMRAQRFPQSRFVRRSLFLNSGHTSTHSLRQASTRTARRRERRHTTRARVTLPVVSRVLQYNVLPRSVGESIGVPRGTLAIGSALRATLGSAVQLFV